MELVHPVQTPNGKTLWEVTTRKVDQKEKQQWEFDMVMVCNGYDFLVVLLSPSATSPMCTERKPSDVRVMVHCCSGCVHGFMIWAWRKFDVTLLFQALCGAADA